MRVLIDRSRWPVLVTYSDLGQGHTGYVYKVSGWTRTVLVRRPVYVDDSGARASRYANGAADARGLTRRGSTELQRWESRICPPGSTSDFLLLAGWRREPIPGRVWRSGNPAYRWVRP